MKQSCLFTNLRILVLINITNYSLVYHYKNVNELQAETCPYTSKTFLQTGSDSQSNFNTICAIESACQFCLQENTYIKNGFCDTMSKLQSSQTEIKTNINVGPIDNL